LEDVTLKLKGSLGMRDWRIFSKNLFNDDLSNEPYFGWISRWKVALNSAFWFGLVCFGLVWFNLVWFGLIWFGLVWFNLVWFGVVWCGVVWCGVVWFGVVWCGVVWFGFVWFGLVWFCSDLEWSW
jgi:hypothetical protein